MTRKFQTLVMGSAVLLAFGLGCSSPHEGSATESKNNAAQAAAAAPAAVKAATAAETQTASLAAGGQEVPQLAAPTTTSPSRASSASSTSSKESGQAASARASALKVKRFVVTTGVKDREPLTTEGVLTADGSPIFAFAELANEGGSSENVRITFERQGESERVGNVTLPVPGQVSRHRTWATTRFIRSAGAWDAVLWSESGQELSRTSFEVTAS